MTLFTTTTREEKHQYSKVYMTRLPREYFNSGWCKYEALALHLHLTQNFHRNFRKNDKRS